MSSSAMGRWPGSAWISRSSINRMGHLYVVTGVLLHPGRIRVGKLTLVPVRSVGGEEECKRHQIRSIHMEHLLNLLAGLANLLTVVKLIRDFFTR